MVLKLASTAREGFCFCSGIQHWHYPLLKSHQKSLDWPGSLRAVCRVEAVVFELVAAIFYGGIG